MDVKIYHNPRCSKSRETLALIRENGIEPEIIEYLKTPPDRDTLAGLLGLLQLKPSELLRRNEPAYKQAGLDCEGVEDAGIIAAMLAHPILVERPIVVANGRAVIGRPPENVLGLIR